MRTPLQLEASRSNGSQSRGPVTSDGKLASSRNTVKHGILSAHVLLRSEKSETFLNLVAGLYDEFRPATAFEESLVDAMAVARWRQQRIWNIERDAMDIRLVAEHDKNRAAMLHPGLLTSMAFGALASETRTLDLVNRYESRFDRQYLRTHRRLLEVQDCRLKSGATPASGPQLVPRPAPASPPMASREPPPDSPSAPNGSPSAPTDSTPARTTPSVSAGNSLIAKRTQAYASPSPTDSPIAAPSPALPSAPTDSMPSPADPTPAPIDSKPAPITPTPSAGNSSITKRTQTCAFPSPTDSPIAAPSPALPSTPTAPTPAPTGPTPTAPTPAPTGPTPAPADPTPAPITPSVSAGNLTSISAKRTQAEPRPFVRIRYRRRDKNRRQPRPNLKSPFPGDTPTKNC